MVRAMGVEGAACHDYSQSHSSTADHYVITKMLDLATRSDAYNVYSIHGTQDSPLTLPPAFQVAEPFGSVYGGVNPIMFAYSPEAQYDSWLTLGVTTGKEAFTGESLSMIGLDLDSWSETQGVHCDNGAMFFMDPAHGPTLEDRDGPLGPREDRGEIVVAQLTVPNEGSYTVTMNAQGRIKDWAEAEEGAIVNWNEEGITFTFGDVEQAGTHTEAPPPPPAPGMIEYETAAVTPIVQTISSDAIEGHTTFRLALRLEGDAYDVYSIYGQEGHPMTIPPAFQNGGTFGVNVGGVNPAFFALDMPGAAGGEFDSWLTVGLTEGAGDELSNIGIQWPSWTDSTGLQVTDGSVFWMTPQDGPTMTDRDGKTGAATEGGDIVVAQLTVKNDQTYTAVINAQGHTQPRPDGRSGESWNEMDIEFTFGTITAAIGPCTLRATVAVSRHGLDGEYVPECDASGGFLAMQCSTKTNCFCVDEEGRALPHDRFTIGTYANGGAFFTEQACLTARTTPPPAPILPLPPTPAPEPPAPCPEPQGEIEGQITLNIEWMSPEEREALDDPTSVGYADAVQSLREYLARDLGVPEEEIEIESILAQLNATPAPPVVNPCPPPVLTDEGKPPSCIQTPFTSFRPCNNGGTCTDEQEHVANVANGEKHCLCNGNWGGDFCDDWDTVDNCQTTECNAGDECIDLFGNAMCAPRSAPEPPVCQGRCQNGGVCNGRGAMARCDCTSDYGGVYCTEYDQVDQCASNPCSNGGACHDLFGEFFCVCDHERFSGRHCETPILEDKNDCEAGGSVQCENGGTCIDLFQAFHCLCREGFHGPNCHDRVVTETPTPAPVVVVVTGHDDGGAGKKHSGGGHLGFKLVMFFLLAGFAAVGVVAYRQRTDMLRASLGDGVIRQESMHGSVYENSIYGHGSLGRDSSMANSVGGAAVISQPTMLEKAKALASKAGAKGVGVAGGGGGGGSSGKSIYDVGASDGL